MRSGAFPGPAGVYGDLPKVVNAGKLQNTTKSDMHYAFRTSKHWTSLWQTLGVASAKLNACMDKRGSYTQLVRRLNVMSTVEDVDSGNCDLRVGRLVALVERAFRTEDEDAWVVYLTDPTLCTVRGYISSSTVVDFGAILVPGSAVILENCALWISRDPFGRYLNIHRDCIQALYG